MWIIPTIHANRIPAMMARWISAGYRLRFQSATMGFGGSGIAVIRRECLRMLPLARTTLISEVMETGSGMYPVRYLSRLMPPTITPISGKVVSAKFPAFTPKRESVS